MFSSVRSWIPIGVAALIAAFVATPAIAGKNGKGKPGDGGDTPPPPPPIHYQLQRLPMPADYSGGTVAVEEMNVHGELVGYYPKADTPGVDLPFYFDAYSGTGTVTNLNDITLDTDWEIPEGWYIDRALGINRHGDIVGMLALISDPGHIRGFVLELRPDPEDPILLPRLHLLPDQQWAVSYARRINDDGLILGGDEDVEVYTYRPPLHGSVGDTQVHVIPYPINIWYDNPALTYESPASETTVRAYDGVAEQIISYTVSTGELDLEDVSGLQLQIRDFADGNRFCGSRPGDGKGKNRAQVGYLFDQGFVNIPEMQWADSLNATSDVIGINSSRRPFLVHPETGVINVDSTVVASSVEEETIWLDSSVFAPVLSERDLTNFPVIAGTIRSYDPEISFFYDAFVLVPTELP